MNFVVGGSQRESGMKINDGGQAFPCPPAGYDQHATRPGMTLRDYLAGQALAGFCANPSVFAPNPTSGWGLVNSSEQGLTAYAYQIADTMLDARGSKEES
jgi:hypothetical protein